MIKHALIIDDDEIFHFLSSRLLRKLEKELHISTFLNGRLGIDFLKTSYTEDDYYFIFLDINMPIMNGWEFLDEIKHVISNPKNIVIYIVSSSTDQKDIARSKEFALVKGYISKPMERDDLNKIF